ncbi:hypothetical protein VMCG_05681 [Cytospora schulzeri]|uniref:Protein Zds1 C-terminal domain-containing protein n=1 Tax=Cytospora schulzeri TaxID=448051 RepID=A0A423WI86_9PEZI|nr:hypothetical protein VMCG_05681 [Valsa malicola]
MSVGSREPTPSWTSSRLREPSASFAQRRGHLSISDPNHHVTEAIGTLYGSDDDFSDDERDNRKSRPLSFVSYGDEALHSRPNDPEDPEDPRRALQRSTSESSPLPSNDGSPAADVRKSHLVPGLSIQRNPSNDNGPPSPSGSMAPLSPTPSLRDMQAAESSMAMTNIDNPSDIAQELSNLQALRRMSMDVGNSSDPDLMPFQGIVPIPSIAPTGDDDEMDPSRLLWVPANVHPELAPEQFKSFLERRVNSVKRRSGDSMLSVDGLQRSDSGGFGGMGSLRRTKSKLSRQIDHSSGHGADGYVDGADMLKRQESLSGYSTPELSLEELVNDPTKAVQKLAQEASDGASGPGDMPILPVAPGMGLRRSTRTQYRKSGSLRGDRTPFSKRVARQSESQEEALPHMPAADAPPGHGLVRVQSEPPRTDNFSRPQRSIKRQHGFTREADSPVEPPTEQLSDDESQEQAHGRSTSDSTEVPPVDERPPSAEQPESSSQYPERSSSQQTQAQTSPEQPPPVPQHHAQARSEEHPPARAKQIPPGRQATTPISLDNVPGPTQTMNDIANHPSAIPGNSGTRTDNLAFIPTFSESDKKTKKDSDGESTKSSKGWKWFKSEDKKKEKEKEEQSRKSKTKSADKSHENARLDVLQSSIENKKADKDAPNKKQHQRAASPERPPPRVLKPDVDYAYTRFPILEERAIYRMAHIKLANPKRNLLSQVLLSNFMYSYLAKIQAMHPQIQVPVSPQQKRQEEERRRKEQEAQQQAYMEQQMSQQQAQNSIDQYNFEYHRSGNQYGDSEGDYVDENQEQYDYEQGRGHGYDEHGQNGGYGYGQDAYGQQQYYDGHDPQREDDENSMW